MEKKTTTELLEIIAWVQDRARCRRECGIVDGAAYAADCKAESDAVRELARRGNPQDYNARGEYGFFTLYA